MFTFIRAILAFLKSILLRPPDPEQHDSNSDSTEAPAPMQLEKQLKKQIKLVLNKENYTLQEYDKAISILSSLRELKLKESVPKEFKCPLSGKIMGDPVVVDSGQTYDRPSIMKWFRHGHKTCPVTKQNLTNSLLTSNDLLKRMITQWHTERSIDPPNPLYDINEAVVMTFSGKGLLNSLLNNMSSSLLDQKSSAKILRQLTKQYPPFRDLFGNEAVSKLLEPLSVPGDACPDLHLQQDIITTVFNISLAEGNEKVVAENPLVIPSLTNALKIGTSETQRNAAAALFELSKLDSNRTLIGASNAVEHLIRLVGEENRVAMTDVCKALCKLRHVAFTTTEREKAAVSVICSKVRNRAFLDLLLPILAMFSRLPVALEEIRKKEVVGCLLEIMKESDDKHSMLVENCAAILFDICSFDKDELEKVKREEAANGTISSVALTGTRRARRKATGILKMGNNVG